MNVHPSHSNEGRNDLWVVLLLAFVLLIVVATPDLPGVEGVAGYPVLHMACEVVAIAVALMVFAVGWNAEAQKNSLNIQLLACMFLGVALLDFAHLASFPYMPEFFRPSYPGKAINFWLMARGLAAIALLIAAVIPWTRAPKFPRIVPLVLVLAFVGVVGVVLIYYPQLVPRTFVPGEGLTHFKIGFEYALIAVNLLAAFLYFRALQRPRVFYASGLFSATLIAAMGEVFLTLYWSVSDVYNLLGHLYKIVAYWFLYQALFVETVQQPYALLQKSEVQLAATLRAIPDFLFEISDAGDYLAVYKNSTGQHDTPIDLVGKNIRDVMSPRALKTCLAVMAEVKRQGYSRGRRICLDLPDGPAWFELSAAQKNECDGGEARYIVLGREVTSLVVTESALKMESERNAALLGLQVAAESRDEPAFLQYGVALAQRLTSSSLAFLFLVDPSENTARRIAWSGEGGNDGQDATASEGVPIAEAGVWADACRRKQISIANSADQCVTMGGFPHGCPALQRLISVPVIMGGKVVMIAGVGNKATDYTEREGETVQLVAEAIWRIISRERANAVARRMSTAVAQSPHSIAITDLAGNIEFVNQALVNTSGYPASELIGQNPRVLQSGKTPRLQYEELWSALSRGESWRGEFINRRKDGREYTERALIYPVRDEAGKIINYLAYKEDISAQIDAAQRINELSYFDALTGLPNRASLETLLNHAVELALHHQESLAVVWMNLDNFRTINDSLGHAVGDTLLREVAGRLRRLMRDEDTLARLSGDHFVAVLTGMGQNEAALWAMRALQEIDRPMRPLGNELIVTASLGIALCPSDGQTHATLLMNAETAMYRMKQEGRNGYRFFTRDIQEHSERTLALGYGLRSALGKNEFQLLYQPQVAVADGALVGVEALLRWNSPQFGEVMPAEFIPIAESYGLIASVGEWVLRTALTQSRRMQSCGLGGLTVAVNLSALQFVQPDLANSIIRLVRETHADVRMIEIELTEAAAMKNPQQAANTMRDLGGYGFRIAIDDFGTGYSSLSYLKRFDVDKLKIDQSFIRDLATSRDDQAIVTAIIQMAHSLGMVALAEGVETAEQLDFLREKGCDLAQGYLFSYPLTPENFEKFAQNHRPVR
jgi:diguanylate cyclase (GGDEF)-like protein/PAS domain S-box-containing protein